MAVANVYLQYVLDLWFESEVIPQLNGFAGLVRYADDFVVCFENEKEAMIFGVALRQRMSKFGLTISEEKSKIIEFGRFTCQMAKKYGFKCETFDFLSFTPSAIRPEEVNLSLGERPHARSSHKR